MDTVLKQSELIEPTTNKTPSKNSRCIKQSKYCKSLRTQEGDLNKEANLSKFDKNAINLDFNLDIDKQYLELESCKKRFVLSPNSPFVPVRINK